MTDRICHACCRPISRFPNTGRLRAVTFEATLWVNRQSSIPNEHKGELLLCSRCWVPVGEALAALTRVLDGKVS